MPEDLNSCGYFNVGLTGRVGGCLKCYVLMSRLMSRDNIVKTLSLLLGIST